MTSQPTAHATPPTIVDMLTNSIGHTVGCYISQCRSGGYVVTVDCVIHSACSTWAEAVAIFARLAGEHFEEPLVAPERPRGVVEVPPSDFDAAAMAERFVRPPVDDEPEGEGLGPRLRTAAEAVVIALVAGLSGVMRV